MIMSNRKLMTGIVSVAMTAVLAASMTGCSTQVTVNTPAEPAPTETAAADKTEEKDIAPVFTKGVYLNYDENNKDAEPQNYYVFNNETEGHTDDGISGLPFVCESREEGVWFSFGGADPESEDFLTVESVENGTPRPRWGEYEKKR